ncbi:MAG: hypothetical protein M1823_001843 [Watsoniomyces obsoletus]|nr:MAG: hypothetical protein M1823_001843 [Watsoniomyces obsoletus]
MREVNFSIPNVNKASVGITTALYDRRALDCTSTLPLINSLNHLAYLTTSSARIRDILTVDGGVERLVCILKDGRHQDMMDMWKWNLAFQCVVNIGVRGSEHVRTRVVEADMVPVIATILDNYLLVVDRCREKADTDAKRAPLQPQQQPQQAQQQQQQQQQQRLGTAGGGGGGGGSAGRTHRTREPRSNSFGNRPERTGSNAEQRASRRQAPPPSIEIPLPFAPITTEPTPMDLTPTGPTFAVTSPPERTTFARPPPQHQHNRSQDGRSPFSARDAMGPRSATPGLTTTAAHSAHHHRQHHHHHHHHHHRADGFGLRPVRDVDRLPSMVSGLPSGITSQPESPTTPHPLSQTVVRTRSVVTGMTMMNETVTATATRSRARPTIRHQRSTSGESDDAPVDEEGSSEASAGVEAAIEPIVDIQPGIQEMDDGDSILDPVDARLDFTGPNASETTEIETFNITHRSAVDGSLINPSPDPAVAVATPPRTVVDAPAPAMPSVNYARILTERPSLAGVMAAMPRDEDVLMSLQLLAYISKYCNLRSYFQQTHLVPRLKLGQTLGVLDDEKKMLISESMTAGGDVDSVTAVEDEEEEYLQPDDYNIFPLVEKFTVRHHTNDMQYWAGVVMRNLCRKDDQRGGIRQCAYYKCGKWEKYTRQFAKCRRCRRTKYCSKECQKSAWVYHRHWCVAASA